MKLSKSKIGVEIQEICEEYLQFTDLDDLIGKALDYYLLTSLEVLVDRARKNG